MTFVAGAYTATYNAKALGQTVQGYTPSHEFFKQLVTGDLMAQTPQDGIYQGRAQFIEFELIEANSAGVVDLIEPYGGGDPWKLGTIGQQDVGTSKQAVSPETCPGAAKPLVLTRVAGLCDELAGPASLTFPLCILAEGFPVRILHGPSLKQIPIRCRIYPDEAGVFGTET